MAARMKILRLIQETRGLAEVASRRPTPRRTGLFAIELRAHLRQTAAQKQKRFVRIDQLDWPDIPHPVKIKHLTNSVSAENPPGSV